MPYKRQVIDYDPVTPSRRNVAPESSNNEALDSSSRKTSASDENLKQAPRSKPSPTEKATASSSFSSKKDNWIIKHGHTITYVGLFLFTAVLYFRPYEMFPSLHNFSSIAFWLALFTLIVFIPTQLTLEGNLTARPREVNLILLLGLFALLSMPLAIRPQEAWDEFSNLFIKVVIMFTIMVNVIRTERRLKGIMFLSLLVSSYLGWYAFDEYRKGNFTVEGYRVAGAIGGMFDNPNDMALQFITMIPIAIVLMICTRSIIKRVGYLACIFLALAGNLVSYSRGGFLGLMAGMGILVWKLGRKNRLQTVGLAVVLGGALLVLAPGNYAMRIASILNPSLDPTGSGSQRRAILERSIITSIANPVFGVGMANFHIVSLRELVTHNSYTQVSSEMGIMALLAYIMFMVSPMRRLKQIEEETVANKSFSNFYYMSVGLQASLVAYMIGSFFVSVAYQWYVYYLVAYAVCLRRLYAIEQDKLSKDGFSSTETNINRKTTLES
jgi:putative inorganic carbon (hco3(-)) transporter